MHADTCAGVDRTSSSSKASGPCWQWEGRTLLCCQMLKHPAICAGFYESPGSSRASQDSLEAGQAGRGPPVAFDIEQPQDTEGKIPPPRLSDVSQMSCSDNALSAASRPEQSQHTQGTIPPLSCVMLHRFAAQTVFFQQPPDQRKPRRSRTWCRGLTPWDSLGSLMLCGAGWR